jgi:hypothetical protein
MSQNLIKNPFFLVDPKSAGNLGTEPCNGYPYPWIFRIKYFKQSFNCKITAKLTKYSGITLQLINFDCL